jgi:hypothetical protein
MQLFDRREFCIFRRKEGNAKELAASKPLNRTERFFAYFFDGAKK